MHACDSQATWWLLMLPSSVPYITPCATSSITNIYPSCTQQSLQKLEGLCSKLFGILEKLNTSALNLAMTCVIFSDADHACCLHTRRSTWVYYILFNGVLISLSCKKQPTTALHSTGAKLAALHCGVFKTILLLVFIWTCSLLLTKITKAPSTWSEPTG